MCTRLLQPGSIPVIERLKHKLSISVNIRVRSIASSISLRARPSRPAERLRQPFSVPLAFRNPRPSPPSLAAVGYSASYPRTTNPVLRSAMAKIKLHHASVQSRMSARITHMHADRASYAHARQACRREGGASSARHFGGAGGLAMNIPSTTGSFPPKIESEFFRGFQFFGPCL